MPINTIRTLSIDAVQAANSGHPGTPMALAPLVYTLWNRVLRFDPQDPIWPNRDRFVLSNGHASMLLWSVLHLTGVAGGERRLRDGSASRRSRSTTSAASASSTARRPGIPSTTGSRASRPPPARSGRASPPASAWRSPQRWLAAPLQPAGLRAVRLRHLRRLRRRLPDGGRRRRRRPRSPATSASTTSAGSTTTTTSPSRAARDIAFTEDVAARFLGYGWNVLRVGDANDLDRIEHALDVFRADARAGPR